MTVTATAGLRLRSMRGYLKQALMVFLINIPTISFGLAMGWVSLASGESGDTTDDVTVVVSAAGTFAAGLLGAPFCARALAYGRRRTMAATTVAMALCWALKLCGGGWWVIAARVSAGLGGAGAWCVAPLVAREMCSERVRGAAAASLVVAHNLGLLLMYIAAEARIQHTTVLVCCLVLSLIPCAALVFVPESPAFLAASGRKKEAMAALAWLRGRDACDPSLDKEVAALPAAETPQAQIPLIKEMLSCPRRRRAFTISLLAIVGQEVCGVLALLQFAERSFVLARGGSSEGAAEGGAAARAVLLGAGQLVASVMALYLVERVGRKPLLVTTALLVATCLGAGAVLISHGAGAGWLPAAALAAAVAADSAGLQPVPYAMAVEMFHYQYRSCVMMLATTFSNLANVVEIVVFPTVVYFGGISAALALASTITFIYAILAFKYVPETKGRTPEQIYDAICGMQIADVASVDAVCGERVRDGASVKVDFNVTIDGAVPNADCSSETVVTSL